MALCEIKVLLTRAGMAAWLFPGWLRYCAICVLAARVVPTYLRMPALERLSVWPAHFEIS